MTDTENVMKTMNRHARRAEKARARKQGTGYLHRIFAGLENAGPGLSFVTLEHDLKCAHHRGGSCDCVPGIYRQRDGTDTVETIHPDGRVTVERRN